MSFIRLNHALLHRERIVVSLFVLFFVVGAFIHLPDLGYRGLIVAIFDFLHFPVFLILFLIVQRVLIFTPPAHYSQMFSKFIVTFGPLIACWSIAVLIELVQPLLHRSASWSDLFVGGAGALFGFWLVQLMIRIKHDSYRRVQNTLHLILFFSVLTLSGVLLLKPVYRVSHILVLKHRAFPNLSTHELVGTPLHWFALPQRGPTQDNDNLTTLTVVPCPVINQTDFDLKPVPSHCIRIDPAVEAWSGLGQIFGTEDWSHYHRLEIYMSAEQPIGMSLRIDDATFSGGYQDRFNHDFELVPDEITHLSIPLKNLRKSNSEKTALNLDQIRKIFLYTAPSQTSTPFYLHRIQLQ